MYIVDIVHVLSVSFVRAYAVWPVNVLHECCKIGAWTVYIPSFSFVITSSLCMNRGRHHQPLMTATTTTYNYTVVIDTVYVQSFQNTIKY